MQMPASGRARSGQSESFPAQLKHRHSQGGSDLTPLPDAPRKAQGKGERQVSPAHESLSVREQTASDIDLGVPPSFIFKQGGC